jgi:hypothetical protein
MRMALTLSALLLATTAVAQDAINAEGLPGPAGRPYSPYADRAFPTDVYFGDTHVHTALSADAGGGGTRLLPRDAYRFARGEQVVSNTGQPVKLSRPLDFYMITDHSDGMGAITDIIGGAPNILADEQGRRFYEAFNAGGETALRAAQDLTASFAQGTISPALNYQPGNPAYKRVWDDIVAAAEEFNDPGVFTTFIAFEWTSLVAGNNLHRNVIFRDGAERAGRSRALHDDAARGFARPARPLGLAPELRGRDRGRRARDPAQREPVERHDVRVAGRLRGRRGARCRVCRDPPEVGAALRGHPDQGRRRGASLPVARGRVRRFRDLGLRQPRCVRSEDARDAARGIRPLGPPARADARGGARDQPLQVRTRRGVRHSYGSHDARQ